MGSFYRQIVFFSLSSVITVLDFTLKKYKTYPHLKLRPWNSMLGKGYSYLAACLRQHSSLTFITFLQRRKRLTWMHPWHLSTKFTFSWIIVDWATTGLLSSDNDLHEEADKLNLRQKKDLINVNHLNWNHRLTSHEITVVFLSNVQVIMVAYQIKLYIKMNTCRL